MVLLFFAIDTKFHFDIMVVIVVNKRGKENRGITAHDCIITMAMIELALVQHFKSPEQDSI